MSALQKWTSLPQGLAKNGPTKPTPGPSILKKSSSKGKQTHRKSTRHWTVSLPGQCLRTMTQLSDRKKRKSVKFPSAVLMQQAIMDGDVQGIKELIADFGRGVASECEPSGLPPVMRCVFEGQLAPLRLLVEAGADLAAQDSESWTALHVAAAMDDVDAAKFIVNTCRHNLTQVRNVDGERPIDLAESTEMATLLLEADLNTFNIDEVQEESHSGESEVAVLTLVHEHFQKNGNCQALNAVMKSNTCYGSLLHLAASKNYPRLASYLLTHRICDLEMRDRRGWTPLHTAAYYNSLDVALLLIQHGSSATSLTSSLETALDLTGTDSHPLMVTLLLEEETVQYL